MFDDSRSSPTVTVPQSAPNDSAHACCEIPASEDPLYSEQAQPRERLVGVPDWDGAAGTAPRIELRDEERTRCEIWTRVMGYHRPVSAWNVGKQAEHAERRYFRESDASS